MSRTKPREMVTGPTAFDNFVRLMRRLLSVPKDAASEPPRRKKAKRPRKTS
jgi:hypothetical protein